MGQHFLKDKITIRKIARTINPGTEETIIEIGPGHGELTELLSAKIRKLKNSKIIAIEKDRRLAEALRQKFTDDQNIKILEGDALRLLASAVQNIKPQKYKIIGNIPYYLTGHLLRIIGELDYKPERCVFTLQKEVAERIEAKPPRMNRIAASIQFWAEPKIIAAIPRTNFWPQPKVDSAIIILKTKPESPKVKAEDYYKVFRILFRQPRKTLVNNLLTAGIDREKANIILKKSGLNPGLRPQNLGMQDILRIVDNFLKI